MLIKLIKNVKAIWQNSMYNFKFDSGSTLLNFIYSIKLHLSIASAASLFSCFIRVFNREDVGLRFPNLMRDEV